MVNFDFYLYVFFVENLKSIYWLFLYDEFFFKEVELCNIGLELNFFYKMYVKGFIKLVEMLLEKLNFIVFCMN